MNEPTIETLAQRLERLERENWWLKHIGSLMLVSIAGLVVMGQSQCNLIQKTTSQPSKVVEAQEFILRDTGGKVRAKIGMTADLGPELSFLDTTGKNRVSLSLSDQVDQGILGFADKDGRRRILLKENLLWLLDRKQSVRGFLSLEDDGSPTLGVSGEMKGPGIDQPQIQLGERNGIPVLQLSDQKGKIRTQLELKPSGLPSLTLSDDKEQHRAVLGTTSLVNKNTGAKTQTAESSLILFNEDGKVIWETP